MEFDVSTRPRRKPSLTPMIDVVFLLLVFFMLASRFGTETMINMPLAGGAGQAYDGPPRLVDVTPEGHRLNGAPVADLVAALTPLMGKPTDMIILRGGDAATLQHIVGVVETLNAAGFTSVVLVE